MSIIYIEEVDDTANCSKTITLFDNEDAALREAAGDVLNAISNWDLCDPEVLVVAKNIQDLINKDQIFSALIEYNNYESDSDNDPVYVNVFSETLKSNAKAFHKIDFSEYELEEEDEPDEEPEPDNSPYLAARPGATCRGPSCGYQSMDAHADKRDGTFECYQCKLMNGVFGK